MGAFSKIICGIKAWWEFNKETSVIYVKPEFDISYCWKELNDVPNMNKASTIYFDNLKEKDLKAVDCQKDGIDLWKLYIIDNFKIERVYMEKRMLQTIGVPLKS